MGLAKSYSLQAKSLNKVCDFAAYAILNIAFGESRNKIRTVKKGMMKINHKRVY